MWSNDIKCKYMFMLPLQNLARKELKVCGYILIAICVTLDYLWQVNGIAFHPVHGTLATVGSDGRFSFWDKDARTKLKTSDQFDQPISTCAFNAQGNIFAYAASYDWSKVRFRHLTHLPLVPHNVSVNWASIDSDNGFLPVRRQAHLN